jgi:putative phosphoesterase
MRIGIISDTHNFFDPQIPKLFDGVEHILHAGDIGAPKILLELEQIAPVTAVVGNTDDPNFRYEITNVVELLGRKFLVHHIVNPRELSEELQDRIESERPQVVVFGHTHKPFCEKIGGVVYFNPGYAGKSRFGMERSIAIMECDEKGCRAKYLKL